MKQIIALTHQLSISFSKFLIYRLRTRSIWYIFSSTILFDILYYFSFVNRDIYVCHWSVSKPSPKCCYPPLFCNTFSSHVSEKQYCRIMFLFSIFRDIARSSGHRMREMYWKAKRECQQGGHLFNHKEARNVGENDEQIRPWKEIQT